jgi:uncharacterized repeat protein (TIGR01451 family)
MPVSTHFALPAYLPQGTYSLRVIANGIASDPVAFVGGFTNAADLSVSNTGFASVSEGDGLVRYYLSVTNNGPSTATKVVLTDTVGVGSSYLSAITSQGSIKQSGNLITFSFGNIAVGQTVTARITTQAVDPGVVTNTATVTSNVADANQLNNTAAFSTIVSAAPIDVSGPITVIGKKQNGVVVATFTHAGGVHAANYYTATINWGDGSTSAGTITKSGTTFTVKGSHTYAANGSHTVSTTVVRAGSGAAAMSYAAASGSGSGASTSASSSAQSATSSKAKAAATPSISPAHKKTSAVDHVILGLTLDRRDRTLSKALASKNLDALDSFFTVR